MMEVHDSSLCGARANRGTCTRPAGWGTNHPGQGKCKLHGGATPIKHGRYSKITRPRLRELLESFGAEENPTDLTPELGLLRALITDYIERYDQFTEALLEWHDSFGPAYLEARGVYMTQGIKWQSQFETWLEEWEQYRVEVEAAQTFYKQGWPAPPDVSKIPLPPRPPQPSEYGGKPRQVTDILDVAKFIGQIGTLTERIEKQRQEGSISLATLDRVMEQVGVEIVKAAQEKIADASTRQAFLDCAEERLGTITVETGTKK